MTTEQHEHTSKDHIERTNEVKPASINISQSQVAFLLTLAGLCAFIWQVAGAPISAMMADLNDIKNNYVSNEIFAHDLTQLTGMPPRMIPPAIHAGASPSSVSEGQNALSSPSLVHPHFTTELIRTPTTQ